MKVQASLKKVAAMLQDAETMSEWMYTTKSVHLVEAIDAKTSIRHIINELPWPAKKRDVIVSAKLSQADDYSIAMHMASVDGHPLVKSKAGLVRAKLEATVSATPLNDGKLQLEYCGHFSPGGSLPSSVYNLLLIDLPYKTFVDFQKWMKKDIFDEDVVNFIKEPETVCAA